MNYLSCGVRMWAQISFALSHCTNMTDGRTDGQTDRQLPHGYTVPCVALHAVARDKRNTDIEQPKRATCHTKFTIECDVWY